MSKELEYVEELKLRYKEENGTVRRLIAIEKSLKALEIIKNKVASLVSLDDGEICKGHYGVYDAELYNYNELTKEEYDLLKEVLA